MDKFDEERTAPALGKLITGRRTVLIRIEYAGNGQPERQLRERCDTLVGMMVEADAGVISGREDGNGAVIIHVLTKYPKRTTETARKIINDLKIGQAAIATEEE